MKLFSFLLLAITFNNCNSQTDLQKITIKYEAATRGSSVTLHATVTELIYKDFEITKTKKGTSQFWDTVTSLIKKITLSEVASFSPPSENRATDAALHATISITVNGKTYTSQTFDHGNPPKELKPLIDTLFSYLELDK